MWQCYQLLSGFLAKGHLLRVSHQSHLNNKGDNEMISGAVHRPDIYLTAEENPRKPQLGDCLMKALQTVSASNGVPYLQITVISCIFLKHILCVSAVIFSSLKLNFMQTHCYWKSTILNFASHETHDRKKVHNCLVKTR